MTICPICGKDLTTAVRLLGKGGIGLHANVHFREKIYSFLSKEEIMELNKFEKILTTFVHDDCKGGV